MRKATTEGQVENIQPHEMPVKDVTAVGLDSQEIQHLKALDFQERQALEIQRSADLQLENVRLRRQLFERDIRDKYHVRLNQSHFLDDKFLFRPIPEELKKKEAMSQ